MSMYRGLLVVDEPGPGVVHMTDDPVAEKIQTISPLTLVVLEKLALFVRDVKNRQPLVLLVFGNGSGIRGSWVDRITEILGPIAENSSKFE